MSQYLFKPGDTAIYIGGCQYADKHGFKAGDKCVLKILNDYLCAPIHGDRHNGLILMDNGVPRAETYPFWKLDDGLGLNKVEPKPECNCHAMYSPKGCSDWCNAKPLKKAA